MGKSMKLFACVALVLVMAAFTADAAYLRELNSASSVWSHVFAAFSGAHALTPAIFNAIRTGDVNTFLNAVCQHYTGNNCYGDARRMLVDNTIINGELSDEMNTEILEKEYPNNKDAIASPPAGHNSADEWLESQTRGHMKSDFDGATISYMAIKGFGNKGSLFVVPGQSEPCAKYDEVLLDFYYAGYSKIYCIDHRGHGYSSRLLPDHFKNHVASSDHFVEDLEKFINTVFVPGTNSNQPRFLACHSMGCAITLGYLTNMYNENKPTVFNAVAFNAPLVKANTSPFPYPIAVAIGEVMGFFGLGENYAPTKEESFEESYGNINFATSTTSSLTRWTRHRDRCINLREKNIGLDNHKGLCLGGVTASMAKEFFDLNVGLEAFKGKIATPLLFQIAGDLETTDGWVMNGNSVNFFNKVKTSGSKLTNYASSKHQIWVEADAIRDHALGEVNQFFETHKNVKKSQCPQPSTCGSWNFKWGQWGCNNPSACSYQYKFGDWHLGMSCRPKPIAC